MLWLQVFNTFCDVAQFLLQSPQLPFYDYFGRALPPCRAKALMQKQFPEVFTSPRTCRKTERERRIKRERERGDREHARSSQWKRIASTLDSIREPIRLRLCGSSCVGVSVVPLCVRVPVSVCVPVCICADDVARPARILKLTNCAL